MPAGQSYTPLLNLDPRQRDRPRRRRLLGGWPRGTGRLRVAQQAVPVVQRIAEGIVSWATRGINLGYQRNYFNVHVDDVFLADAGGASTPTAPPVRTVLTPDHD